MIYFIEQLTVRGFFFVIVPRLLRDRPRSGSAGQRLYVIDGARAAAAIARLLGRMTGVSVERLQFRLLDIRDDDGLLLRFRVPCQDLLRLRAEIMKTPVFRGVVAQRDPADRLPTFLGRVMTSSVLFEERTLWRALQVIQICAWKMKSARSLSGGAVCFLERRPWLDAIRDYAAACGITVIPVPAAAPLRARLRRHLSPELLNVAHALRSYWVYARLRLRTAWKKRRHAGAASRPRRAMPTVSPRIAVEYFGHLNLDHPERYSDLFFWQQSSLPASDLLVTFSLAQDPLDERKWAELADHGLSAIALQPHAATAPAAPVFLPHPLRGPRTERAQSPAAWNEFDARWLSEQVRDYQLLRAFWSEFFATERVKIFVSGFKYNATHCAIADAMQGLGGVTGIYQRAHESNPSVETTVAADVVFGFSQGSAGVERGSGSIIPYHVTTGYLGDHRFPLLRERAERIRARLQRHGAQRILGFADENSHDDPRWHTGHGVERENYAFLLEHLLAERRVGLVIKPKTPATLRRRLGPVAELLKRAETTGRCFVFEEGAIQGSYPPAAAALASDLMIHGHLIAATAGLDSALAGVPTLLLDRVGWPLSPFYQLGAGRVVFTDWPSVWKVLLEHWNRPGGIDGLGDWSPMLHELDPFRDGRAAERMGAYLHWLLEGFQAGLDRETVMADAAERYASTWGNDKITHVRWHPAASLQTERVDAEGAGVAS